MTSAVATRTIGFVGLGNMGGAVARGLIATGVLRERVFGFDIEPDRAEACGVTPVADIATLGVRSDIIVVAVKPAQVSEVVSTALRNSEAGLVISLAAGVPIASIRGAIAATERYGDTQTSIVRVMPNLGAAFGASATALVAEDGTDDADVAAASAVFETVGSVIKLQREADMHAFTGAVASGIAYAFVFAEAVADGAVAEGLPRPLALQSAGAMLSSAAAVLAGDERGPAALKDAVCSPAGTTIEGVAALESLGMRNAVIAAVRAAAQRSRELGGEA